MANSLNQLERRSIAALASIYALRMYGLFLLLPVLVIYAEQLDGATPMMMGLALGIYGITQAILQIPFGALSDRFGRKPLIIFGLGLFALGSLVAAFANSIEGVVLGRALQGAGAIASVVLALTSDLTRENQRSKAMAIIGVSIGGAFVLAMITAPVLEFWIGVSGLFLMTGLLAVAAMLLVIKAVPTPVVSRNLDVKPIPAKMLELLQDADLLKLDLGIFALHMLLTAMFVVVPVVLLEGLDLEISSHWRVYLPALLWSLPVMAIAIRVAKTGARTKWVFCFAIALLFAAVAMFLWGPSNLNLAIITLAVFFSGFNTLEALLPSLVSRLAPAGAKGSAMGVYNTFQFMGIFAGGLIGGMLFGEFGVRAVFVLLLLMLLAWGWLSYRQSAFELYDAMTIKLAADYQHNCADQIRQIRGVKDVMIFAGEDIAYLKVDKALLDQASLQRFATD